MQKPNICRMKNCMIDLQFHMFSLNYPLIRGEHDEKNASHISDVNMTDPISVSDVSRSIIGII